MWRTFFLVILFCSQWFVSTAAFELTLKKSIPLTDGYFTTDPIGNIYLVKDKNFIVKYNAQGDSLGVFNDISSGAVTQIDATNPLRVLVFYSGFSKIKILDNLLSLKNELDLSRIGLFNIPAIANSMDGNIWVYDPSGNLLKIDEDLRINQSFQLRNILDFNVDPSHMVERDRTLYMTDAMHGILQFDRFGFYQTMYTFLTAECSVINHFIVYYQEGFLKSYDIKSLRASEIALPDPENIISSRLEKNQVYILRPNALDIYVLNQN